MKRICRQAATQATQCARQAAQSRHQIHLRDWTSCDVTQQQRSYARPARHRQPNDSRDDDFLPATQEDADVEALINENELSSTGHAELEQHRELREMVRLAAWEMPLLSTLSKPFKKPSSTKSPLRWRYTTYFGESHPASRKVVVTFKVKKIAGLTEKQQEKLRKLAGSRYRLHDKASGWDDVIRMSCESFETQAQNKRFLGDTIEKLVKEAKDETDMFEDVPLDLRHVKKEKQFTFPEEWKITSENGRQAELEERRRALLLEEGERVEQNTVVSGAAAIEAARQVSLRQLEEPVMAEARQQLPKGKMGKKEMGQTRGANR